MYVDYSVSGPVAILTLNRPEALNALHIALLAELRAAVERAAADDAVLVLVLTGAGRAFAAGADIGEMKDFTPVEARAFSENADSVFSAIEDLDKPVLAAVNGYALGGGLELALSCDIRLAGTRAAFGFPEVSLGITPGFGGTQRLPRLVGLSRAKELIFSAKTVKAEEALSMGLVNRVVPDGELMDAALALANSIAANAQVAVRQSKAAMNRGTRCGLETGLAFESQAFALCFSTPDQREAMQAFLEKRTHGPFQNR